MQTPNWYAVYTLPNYEEKVKKKIKMLMVNNERYKDMFFQVEIPVEEKITRKRGQKRTKTQKLFPGYVFIKMIMNDSTYQVVRNISGVKGFVGTGTEPIPLTREEIKRMGIKDVTPFEGFDVGETVIITEGPFENFIGVIKDIDKEKEKIKVELQMFGRNIMIDFNLNQLKKLQ